MVYSPSVLIVLVGACVVTFLINELSETEVRAGGRSWRAGQLSKLRLLRPQAFLCVGACMRAHTPGGRTSLVRTAAAIKPTRAARASAYAGRARCPSILDTKGLSAAAPILEEYGLSCENNMSLLDEEDLVVLLQYL